MLLLPDVRLPVCSCGVDVTRGAGCDRMSRNVQIPKELTDAEVRGWFEPYGSLVSIVVKRNPKAGVSGLSFLAS